MLSRIETQKRINLIKEELLLGNNNEVLQQLTTLIKNSSLIQNEQIQTIRGIAYYRNKKYEQAAYAFNNAYSYNKKNSDHLNNRALALIQLKKYQQAYRILVLAVDYLQDPIYYNNMIKIVYETGKHQLAEQLTIRLSKVQNFNPNYTAYEGLAEPFERKQLFDKFQQIQYNIHQQIKKIIMMIKQKRQYWQKHVFVAISIEKNGRFKENIQSQLKKLFQEIKQLKNTKGFNIPANIKFIELMLTKFTSDYMRMQILLKKVQDNTADTYRQSLFKQFGIILQNINYLKSDSNKFNQVNITQSYNDFIAEIVENVQKQVQIAPKIEQKREQKHNQKLTPVPQQQYPSLYLPRSQPSKKLHKNRPQQLQIEQINQSKFRSKNQKPVRIQQEYKRSRIQIPDRIQEQKVFIYSQLPSQIKEQQIITNQKSHYYYQQESQVIQWEILMFDQTDLLSAITYVKEKKRTIIYIDVSFKKQMEIMIQNQQLKVLFSTILWVIKLDGLIGKNNLHFKYFKNGKTCNITLQQAIQLFQPVLKQISQCQYQKQILLSTLEAIKNILNIQKQPSNIDNSIKLFQEYCGKLQTNLLSIRKYFVQLENKDDEDSEDLKKMILAKTLKDKYNQYEKYEQMYKNFQKLILSDIKLDQFHKNIIENACFILLSGMQLISSLEKNSAIQMKNILDHTYYMNEMNKVEKSGRTNILHKLKKPKNPGFYSYLPSFFKK